MFCASLQAFPLTYLKEKFDILCYTYIYLLSLQGPRSSTWHQTNNFYALVFILI